MASIQFGPSDRDERGFVKAPEPRSLADLLPTPASIQADAQRPPQLSPTKAEWAAMLALGLLLFALFIYLRSADGARPAAPPRVAPTIPATTQAGGDGAVLPSPIPAAAPIALVGYFDYADPSTAAAITDAQITRVIGRAVGDWRLVLVGDARLWVRSSEVPAGTASDDPLPDLSPRAPAPPQAAPQPAYVPAGAPAAPAADPPTPTPPPPCAEAGIAGKMVRVCDYAELGDLEARAKAQWIAQYGGNAGIVTTPTPQEWNR